MCYATDVPAGKANDIYSDCYDASAAKVYGTAMADWVIADSGGKAHTLVVVAPGLPDPHRPGRRRARRVRRRLARSARRAIWP